MTAHAPPTRGHLLITAVSFAACQIGGIALAGELLGSFGDSDRHFQDYYASSGNQSASLVGAVLFLAGSVVLLGFFAQLATRVGRQQRGALGFGMATALMGTSLLAAGAASLGAVGGARKFGFGDTGQLLGSEGVLPQLAFVLVVCSTVPLASSMVTFARQARRSGLAGPWFPRGTVAAAVLMVVGAPSVVIPVIALPVWTIVAAARVRRPEDSAD